jgi:DNA-binding CsgD family transcriptional regulator
MPEKTVVKGLPLGPCTMQQLYQLSTGDRASHQRRIDGQVRKLAPRRLRVLRARCTGQSLAEIGAAEGISHGSVASLIRKSMEAARKAIAGEPRFNRTGHPGGRAQKPRQSPAA